MILGNVYKSKDLNTALEELESFCDKWKRKYPRVIESLKRNKNLFTYYSYPECIRSSIYTTNLIEGYNKQLKKNFKKKEQFPNEQSMEKFLVSQFEQYNHKFMNRVHKGFGLVRYEEWFSN